MTITPITGVEVGLAFAGNNDAADAAEEAGSGFALTLARATSRSEIEKTSGSDSLPRSFLKNPGSSRQVPTVRLYPAFPAASAASSFQ